MEESRQDQWDPHSINTLSFRAQGWGGGGSFLLSLGTRLSVWKAQGLGMGSNNEAWRETRSSVVKKQRTEKSDGQGDGGEGGGGRLILHHD